MISCTPLQATQYAYYIVLLHFNGSTIQSVLREFKNGIAFIRIKIFDFSLKIYLVSICATTKVYFSLFLRF